MASPSLDGGTVIAIHVAPATRLPMKSVTEVEAEAGLGLVGDRYHGTKHRHVTVQSALALAEAEAALGRSIDPGTTRRNITVSGGSGSGPSGGLDVPARPGDRLLIGSVELEVVRIAAPCKLLDDAVGDGARNALRRRAGSVCRLLTSGPIAIGAPVLFALRPDPE